MFLHFEKNFQTNMNSETCSAKNSNGVNLTDATSKLNNNVKYLCIDLSTIRYKIHFMLMTGGQALIIPCIAVFAKNRLHLSPASFAVLVMSYQFSLVFSKPVVGYIVDYFNKLKAVILAVTLLYLLSICLLLILPPIPKQKETSYNEVRFKLKDVCQLQRNFNNSTNGMSAITLQNREMYENSTYFGKEKNCTVLFENFMNTSKSETLYSSRTSQAINAFPIVNNKMCHELYSCELIYQGFNITKEICILCCESIQQCLTFSEKYFEKEATKNERKENDASDFLYYQFWLFAILFVVFYTCTSSIFTLTDTALCATVELLGKDFGKERVWGAFGWGLFAPVGGFLDDVTDNYVTATILCVIIMLVMLLNLSKIDMEKPHISQNILKDVGIAVKSGGFLYFFTVSVANGIGYGIVWHYLTWHVVNIGGDRLICGLVHAMQCFAGEIPFMFCSGWIIRKVGYFHTTTLALLAFCARFFWYSKVKNVWFILLSEWTHGIAYGLFYTSIVTFSKANCIPGTEATTQSIIVSGYEGLGSGLGNMIAGVGFNYFGGHQTFFYCGAFFGICVVLNICYTINEKCRTRLLTIQEDTIQTKC